MTALTTLRSLMLIAALGVMPYVAHAQTTEDRTQDRVAFPAHKIMGNLYYVGTGTLNSYLITTPDGHILINTNFEETVPLLQASVEKLGFKMAEIKIILGSHAHGDHMQADAIVKELTGGATVMAMEQDVPALKGMKAPSGKAHPIDRVLKDGEQVTLGGTRLMAHLTPGHTRGCTTWTTTIQDGGKPYNVLIACGGLQEDARLVNNKNYPEIAEDFGRSINKYKTLQADVFLAAHSWFFDLAGKYKRLGSATNPYVDPAGFKRWLDNMEKNYNTLMAEQKKNPPTN
ncbi:MAG: subclass B3 metallo-beta-lactamase [Vicinamibacterales bacterium]